MAPDGSAAFAIALHDLAQDDGATPTPPAGPTIVFSDETGRILRQRPGALVPCWPTPRTGGHAPRRLAASHSFDVSAAKTPRAGSPWGAASFSAAPGKFLVGDPRGPAKTLLSEPPRHWPGAC